MQDTLWIQGFLELQDALWLQELLEFHEFSEIRITHRCSFVRIILNQRSIKHSTSRSLTRLPSIAMSSSKLSTRNHTLTSREQRAGRRTPYRSHSTPDRSLGIWPNRVIKKKNKPKSESKHLICRRCASNRLRHTFRTWGCTRVMLCMNRGIGAPTHVWHK